MKQQFFLPFLAIFLFQSVLLGQELCDANLLLKEIKAFNSTIITQNAKLLDNYLTIPDIVSKSLNRNFVEKVAFDPKIQTHYEFGFVALKSSNTVDKDFGTALANLGKQKLSNTLDEIRKKYPDLDKFYKIHIYHDFKGIRIALEAKGSSKLSAQQLNLIMAELTTNTQKKIATELKSLNIDNLNIKGNISSWFVGGAGKTLDESALLARLCRTSATLCVDGFSGFNTTSSKSLLTIADKARAEVVGVQTSIVSSAKELGLSGELLENGFLKKEIIDVVRKNLEDPVALKKQLEYLISKKISGAQSEKLMNDLRDYYQKVDNFQPAILIPEREILALPGKGGISADVKGLGIINFDYSQKALLGSSKQKLGEALVDLRKGEVAATVEFMKIKENLVKVLGADIKVVCSGDDCLGSLANGKIMTSQQRQQIVQKLAAQGQQDKFRLTFLPDQKDAVSTASRLESVEKTMPTFLQTEFKSTELKQIAFIVDGSDAKKGVQLIVAVDPSNVALVAKIKEKNAQLVNAFVQSAQKIDGQLVAVRKIVIVEAKK